MSSITNRGKAAQGQSTQNKITVIEFRRNVYGLLRLVKPLEQDEVRLAEDDAFKAPVTKADTSPDDAFSSVSASKAAGMLGVSKTTIYNLMNSGDLAYFTLGTNGDRRIMVKDIERYIKRHSS